MTTTTMTTTTSMTATKTAAAEASVRAVVQAAYGAPEAVLRVGTAARPVAGEHEVIVRVQAAAIDRGTWHMATGRPYLMRVMGFGFRAPKNPIAGLDLAGTVVEVGPGVTRFRVGDVVFGIGKGSFAELACAHEDKLALVPPGVSVDDAAALAVSGGTALQAIDAAGLKAGERVLVLGASGGVGTFAVQIARALGADVTAACSASKVERVRALGVERVVDYRAADFLDGTDRYDVILDLGGNTPLSRLRRAMTPVARLVFVGGENGGDITAGFERQIGAMLLMPFVKQRFVPLAAREHFSFFERLAALCESGAVRPVIDRRIALDGVAGALADLEHGGVFGKIAVDVSH